MRQQRQVQIIIRQEYTARRCLYSAKCTRRAFLRGGWDSGLRAWTLPFLALGLLARELEEASCRPIAAAPPGDAGTSRGFLAVVGLVMNTGFLAFFTCGGSGSLASGSGMSKSGKSSSSLGSDDCVRKVGFYYYNHGCRLVAIL